MGFISRFKTERGIPRLTTTQQPGFTLYSFPAMRRLSTLTGTTNLIGPASQVLTLYIPGNWWAEGHEVLWREYFTWIDGGFAPPPGIALFETCTDNQGGTGLTFATPAPPVAMGTVQGCISRRLLRQNNQILFWDDDFPQGQFGFSGLIQSQPAIIMGAPMGGWDFTQELQLAWTITNAGMPWAVQITVDNAIALIAPPLTLRS